MLRPVLGIRRCRTDPEFGLHSVWKRPQVRWPEPPTPLPDAECLKESAPILGMGIPAHSPKAPESGCVCGYYACWPWGEKADGYYLSPQMAEFVGIAVTGTGRLIPHEWGFRASTLRVLAIILPDHLIEVDDHKMLMSVAERYGVPLVRRGGLGMLAQEHDLEVSPWKLASPSDSL